MSQAIPAFTPPPPSYPYLASSSSGMPGDSIAPVIVGVTVGGLLTAAAVTLAVKDFSTSGDKPKPAQATSLRPVERTHTPQLKSVRTSTKEISPQPPQRPLEPASASTEETPPQPSPPPPQPVPQPQGQRPTRRALPGYVDNSRVYRERQNREDVRDVFCGRYAMNTVLYNCFEEEEFEGKIITDEEFKEAVPNLFDDEGAGIDKLVKLANKKGLGVTVYATARRGGASIRGIDDAKDFIICKPGHAVAMVRPKAKIGHPEAKVFFLSDSWDQDKDEVYPATQPVTQEGVPRTATATEAFLEYQERNNLIAPVVITFHERIWANGPEYGVNNFRV